MKKNNINLLITTFTASLVILFSGVGHLYAATTADVANLTDLQTALASTTVDTINITANISGIPATLVVPVGHPVTINGGGFTLTFTGLESVSGNVDDGFMVQAPATINNLIVDAGLTVPTTWAGTYAIHIYNTSATLNDVTATHGNGGILVNGSAVTLTGVTTVTGNGFGGIEVSASIPNGLPNSILTVTGTLVNGTEAYGKPTIWLVNGQGTVIGANVPSTTSTTIVAGQTQYYLTAGNSVDPAIPPTNKNQCKNDGWKTFTNPVFKNQGECVSYVEKQKDNDKHDNHKDNGHGDKDNKDNKDNGHGDKNNNDDRNHETNSHGHSVKE